ANRPEPFDAGNKNLASAPPVAVQQLVATPASLLPGIETEKVLRDSPKNAIPRNTGTPVKLAKKKVWEWGITGGAGLSWVGDGLSELLGKGNADNSFVNALPNAPNMTNNIGYLTGQNSMVAALPPPASPVRNGLA